MCVISIVAMLCVMVFNMTNVITDETTSQTHSFIVNQTRGNDVESFVRDGMADKLRDGLCDTPTKALLCQFEVQCENYDLFLLNAGRVKQ